MKKNSLVLKQHDTEGQWTVARQAQEGNDRSLLVVPPSNLQGRVREQ